MSGAEASLGVKVKVEVSEPALILGRKWRGCSLYSLGVYQDSVLPPWSRGVPWGATDTALTLTLVQACCTGNQKCLSVSEPFLRPA